MYCNYVSRSKKGFSTIELLVAMAVLVMCLSAVILVSFGSQSMMVDSQTNSEAINKAQELLESEQALARKDFKLVNPMVTMSDGIYQKKIEVVTTTDSTTGLEDFFTKKVTATVSWMGEYNRALSVQLSALVTNFENAIGGDTCNSVLTGNWANPIISNPPIFVGNTNNDASLSVDAYKQKLYVAISDADATNTPTLFVYSLIPDPKNPYLISSIDNADIKAGISDIHVADKYIYAAKATGSGSGQLQIFDISGATPVKVGNDFKITGAGGIGNSIFYKDGYVYLGLTATTFGPEFHIIDVHNPYNPLEVGNWPQTGNLGYDINEIYVKGRYVYLAIATPYSQELIVLDINNPTSPSQVGGFDALGSSNGKSIYLVGDTLYLGRTVGDTEFYILDDKDPTADQLPELGSKQEIDDSVNGLIVRDYLAFLITTGGQFQVWRIDNPSNITSYATRSLGNNGTSLDCEGNYFYAGSVSSSNEGYLSVIYAL